MNEEDMIFKKTESFEACYHTVPTPELRPSSSSLTESVLVRICQAKYVGLLLDTQVLELLTDLPLLRK